MDDDYYVQGTRSALTQTMRNQIKEAVGGKCELCLMSYPRSVLDIHHIKPVKDADGSFDANSPSNLIVLCANCHRLVHRSENSDIKCTEIVYNRTYTEKRLIEEALANRAIYVSDSAKGIKAYSTDGGNSHYTKSIDSGFASDFRYIFGGIMILMIIAVLYYLFYMLLGDLLSRWITPHVIDFINPTSTAQSITDFILWAVSFVLKVFIAAVVSVLIGYGIIFAMKKLLSKKAWELNDQIISDELDGIRSTKKYDPIVYFFRPTNEKEQRMAPKILAIAIFLLFIVFMPVSVANSVDSFTASILKDILLSSTLAVMNFIVSLVVFIITLLIIGVLLLYMWESAKENARYNYGR